MDVGIDVIEIDRIKKSITNKRFINRIFSEQEIRYFTSINYKLTTIAANFAAKEALYKILNKYIKVIPFNKISILRDSSGRPYILFHKDINDFILNLNISFSISITHSKTDAIAMVISHSK